MKTLAIIPARGGSQRIPRKNIKNFLGKPIMAYAIETAIRSGLFDEVMVSTDDDEIIKIAQTYGASVPFKRSANTANDHATTAEVLNEVLSEYAKMDQHFELGCCLYPTAALTRVAHLKSAVQQLELGYDTVFPVVEFSYPIHRGLKLEEEKVSMVWPENLRKRSQDLPKTYHDAGQFYWFKVDSFLKQKELYTQNSSAIVLDGMEAQDIDNLSDWKLAELKYQMYNSK